VNGGTAREKNRSKIIKNISKACFLERSWLIDNGFLQKGIRWFIYFDCQKHRKTRPLTFWNGQFIFVQNGI
jgi:hypothetical protein